MAGQAYLLLNRGQRASPGIRTIGNEIPGASRQFAGQSRIVDGERSSLLFGKIHSDSKVSASFRMPVGQTHTINAHSASGADNSSHEGGVADTTNGRSLVHLAQYRWQDKVWRAPGNCIKVVSEVGWVSHKVMGITGETVQLLKMGCRTLDPHISSGACFW